VVVVEGKADQKRLGGDDRAVRQIICDTAEEWQPPESGAEPPPELPAAEDVAPVAPSLPAWALDDPEDLAGEAALPPSAPPPPLEIIPEPTPLGRLLHLRFVRGGDAATDLERLRSLHRLLTERPGPDRFDLVVVYGTAEHRLVVPEPHVSYNPDVERALRGLLGAENVRVL
jgi:hypothetical protein